MWKSPQWYVCARDCVTRERNDTRKFGTLEVEDLEEDPTDRSSKPKKVCAPAVAHLPESH